MRSCQQCFDKKLGDEKNLHEMDDSGTGTEKIDGK